MFLDILNHFLQNNVHEYNHGDPKYDHIFTEANVFLSRKTSHIEVRDKWNNIRITYFYIPN